MNRAHELILLSIRFLSKFGGTGLCIHNSVLDLRRFYHFSKPVFIGVASGVSRPQSKAEPYTRLKLKVMRRMLRNDDFHGKRAETRGCFLHSISDGEISCFDAQDNPARYSKLQTTPEIEREVG